MAFLRILMNSEMLTIMLIKSGFNGTEDTLKLNNLIHDQHFLKLYTFFLYSVLSGLLFLSVNRLNIE